MGEPNNGPKSKREAGSLWRDTLAAQAEAGRGFDTDALFYAGFSAFWALLWVPYFIYSDRVKNTFVR